MIIASYEEKNSMSVYNVAVCLMPTIFRPEKYDMTDFAKQKHMVNIT